LTRDDGTRQTKGEVTAAKTAGVWAGPDGIGLAVGGQF